MAIGQSLRNTIGAIRSKRCIELLQNYRAGCCFDREFRHLHVDLCKSLRCLKNISCKILAKTTCRLKDPIVLKDQTLTQINALRTRLGDSLLGCIEARFLSLSRASLIPTLDVLLRAQSGLPYRTVPVLPCF